MAKSQNRIVLGVFEVAVFLAKGVGRFPVDRRSALTSFWVVAALSVVAAWLFSAVPSERLGARGFSELLAIYACTNFLSAGLLFAAIYLVCKKLEKPETFWPFVTASNYITLAPSVVTLPLALSVVYGAHSWEEIYNLLIVLFFYGVALQGFVATHVLRVPWEFGAAIGFFAMFISQAVGKTVFALWGIA